MGKGGWGMGKTVPEGLTATLPPHPPSPILHPQHVAIVAGEASGDLLGGLLIRSLQEAGVAARFSGIAGPRMQAAGARSLYPMETLAVRGYVEALSNIRRILAIRRQLRRSLLEQRPRLFIGVDAPDFNLSLETALRAGGITTVHFVSPSIWAWRRGRIRKIRKAVSHMLLIFPFEEEIYRRAGIPATYVGHPLAHALPEPNRAAARERLGLRHDAEYVALLPGSRQGELRLMGRTFVETAKELHRRRPEARFLIPLASRETRQMLQETVHQAGAGELPLRILFGHAHDAMQAADAALIASGTATLEALLLGCPHIITYQVPWLTYQIMMRQAYLPHVGLPNILAGRPIVPEILQQAATPEALADALAALLDDPSARSAMQTEFRNLRGELRRDTPRMIAETLRPLLR
jgi:lipid-A-disaccharide synthase